MTWEDDAQRATIETTSTAKKMDPHLHGPDPGKGSPTGNAYIDHGTLGDQGIGTVLLTAEVRNRLVPIIRENIHQIEENCRDAIMRKRMDKIAEHENADVPWLAAMLIGMVGALLSYNFNEMLRELRASPLKAVGTAAEAGVTITPQVAQTALSSSNPLSLEGIMKGALDTTRGTALIQTSRQIGSADHQKKTEAVHYLDEVAEQMSSAYHKLAQNAPAAADDGGLLTLYASLQPDSFPISYFEMKIDALLRKYMASHATDIGRKDRDSDTRPDEDRKGAFAGGKDAVHDTFETRVAWMIGGTKPRLAYVDRRFHVSGELKEDSAYTKLPMLGLHQDGANGHAWDDDHDSAVNDVVGIYAAVEETDMFYGWVEDEFVETAIARHNTMWAEEIKSYWLVLGQNHTVHLLPMKQKPGTKAP